MIYGNKFTAAVEKMKKKYPEMAETYDKKLEITTERTRRMGEHDRAVAVRDDARSALHEAEKELIKTKQGNLVIVDQC